MMTMELELDCSEISRIWIHKTHVLKLASGVNWSGLQRVG